MTSDSSLAYTSFTDGHFYFSIGALETLVPITQVQEEY